MRTLYLVNPHDSWIWRHRYILQFGAYYNAEMLVWADSLEDALDECVDAIAEHFPGLLMDDAVHEEYKRLFAEYTAEGMHEEEAAEKAQEEAEMDMTCAGNCGHYIASWEWAIGAEDPTRAEIKAYDRIVFDWSKDHA